MKSRGIILVLLALSILGFGVGHVLSESYQYGVCIENDISCHYFFERVGDAVFYGMGALAVVFLGLLAVPKAFDVWKKFAIWFVPLTALLFAFYGDPGSGDLFSPYPETVFQWVSGLYVAVSAGIIASAAAKNTF